MLESLPPVVLYESDGRNFQRVLKDATLEELRASLTTALRIKDTLSLRLVQVWNGQDVELDTDDDFEAFSIRTKREGFATVRVALSQSDLAQLSLSKGVKSLEGSKNGDKETIMTPPQLQATEDVQLTKRKTGDHNAEATAKGEPVQEQPITTTLVTAEPQKQSKKRARKEKSMTTNTEISVETAKQSDAINSRPLSGSALEETAVDAGETKKASKKRKKTTEEGGAKQVKKRKKSKTVKDDATQSMLIQQPPIDSTEIGFGDHVVPQPNLDDWFAKILLQPASGGASTVQGTGSVTQLASETEFCIDHRQKDEIHNRDGPRSCPVCRGSYHLRARCPIIKQGVDAIQERIEVLRREQGIGNQNKDLIRELERFLRKKARKSPVHPAETEAPMDVNASQSSSALPSWTIEHFTSADKSTTANASSDDQINESQYGLIPFSDERDLQAVLLGPSISNQKSILHCIPLEDEPPQEDLVLSDTGCDDIEEHAEPKSSFRPRIALDGHTAKPLFSKDSDSDTDPGDSDIAAPTTAPQKIVMRQPAVGTELGNSRGPFGEAIARGETASVHNGGDEAFAEIWTRDNSTPEPLGPGMLKSPRTPLVTYSTRSRSTRQRLLNDSSSTQTVPDSPSRSNSRVRLLDSSKFSQDEDNMEVRKRKHVVNSVTSEHTLGGGQSPTPFSPADKALASENHKKIDDRMIIPVGNVGNAGKQAQISQLNTLEDSLEEPVLVERRLLDPETSELRGPSNRPKYRGLSSISALPSQPKKEPVSSQAMALAAIDVGTDDSSETEEESEKENKNVPAERMAGGVVTHLRARSVGLLEALFRSSQN